MARISKDLIILRDAVQAIGSGHDPAAPGHDGLMHCSCEQAVRYRAAHDDYWEKRKLPNPRRSSRSTYAELESQVVELQKELAEIRGKS